MSNVDLVVGSSGKLLSSERNVWIVNLDLWCGSDEKKIFLVKTEVVLLIKFPFIKKTKFVLL